MSEELNTFLNTGEIVVWFPPTSSPNGLNCVCRTIPVSESTGSIQVCPEILFINGTNLTTTNYTVTMHTNGLSGTARSKYKNDNHDKGKKS